MSSETSHPSLSSLARSKLHLGGSHNLHRWVLSKNLIIRAVSSTSSIIPSQTNPAPQPDAEDEDENTEDADSFMFPDAGKFVDSAGDTSEAQWLDSLLETLGEDDEEDFGGDSGSMLQQDDDFDQILSPLPSPMSSSDDLLNQSYLSSSFSYPYLAPYPPFHPPLVNSYHPDSSSLDPLPYYDVLDDVADLPVPDAIEDTSDDESDSPLTPSIQSDASLTLVDPAAVPLPPDGTHAARAAGPQVFINSDTSFFPYELFSDPLPFSDFRATYNLYHQEC